MAGARDFAAIARGYVEGVISGDIPACQWVKLACKRHENDLKKQNTPAFPYVYDEKRGIRACKFAEKLPHVKGAWAKRRERFTLRPDQVFFFMAVFGWVSANGRRRFRKVYRKLPRKNGKSFEGAAIGLYMLTADGEVGAEVYSGATSEKQAWEVFGPAHKMAARTPGLLSHYGVTVHAKSLTTDDGGKFEPLIGKPGDGASPHCAIIDEYHEHSDATAYNAMDTGMMAREQPLLVVITTAGTTIGGPCWELEKYAEDVLSGAKDDDALFCVMYGIDMPHGDQPGDDWQTLEAAQKANPGYNVSIYPDALEAKLRTARQSATDQNAYKTKHLNMWVGARDAWLPANLWTACPKPLPLEALRGRRCFLGFDLASVTDVAVRAALFPPLSANDLWHVHMRFYLPQGLVDAGTSPNTEAYRRWAEQGVLTLTAGDITDHQQIIDDTRDLAQLVQIVEGGYDPNQAQYFAATLMQPAAVGQHPGPAVAMVQVPQNVGQLSEPMKKLEALVRVAQLAHDNPMLTWMVNNTTARKDAKEQVFPRKDSDEKKIDGTVALIIAMNRALAAPQHSGPLILTF